MRPPVLLASLRAAVGSAAFAVRARSHVGEVEPRDAQTERAEARREPGEERMRAAGAGAVGEQHGDLGVRGAVPQQVGRRHKALGGHARSRSR